MSTVPWKEWIPGALNDRQLQTLIDQSFIENASGCAVDYSSIDLRLDGDAYEMIEGSVKPQGWAYEEFLRKDTRFARPTHMGPKGEMVLQPKKTYVFKLKERLSMKLKGSNMHGQATAKSSVGRVDVLARLIVDGMHCYEGFDDDMWTGGNGSMFLEVTPMTFPVRVKEGSSLSQLRFFYGDPGESEIRGKELYEALLLRDDNRPVDQFLRVDVSSVTFKDGKAAAFKAKANSNPVKLWVDKDNAGKPIDLTDPKEYWELAPPEDGRFRITETNFYILRSKEKIILRRGVCVYCRAIDETIGEMRIHYAGFVHPYFGFPAKPENPPGTPLIFEVRGHDVDVVLNNDEPLARLQFYRMSEDCAEPPDPKTLSPYTGQKLMLSKFFDEFAV
jgi:dCTP deaminase